MTGNDRERNEERPLKEEAAANGRGTLPEGMQRFAINRSERPPRLSVNNALGAIAVRGYDGEGRQDFIGVRAVKADGEAIPLDSAAEVHFTPDGEIEVRTRPAVNIEQQVRRAREVFDFGKSTFLDDLGEIIESAVMGALGPRAARIALEIVVPRRCDLNLATTNGGIGVAAVEGEVNVKTANGRVQGRRIRGKLVAKTANGRIEIEDVEGAALLQTANGAIRTERVTGNLVIKTASGGARTQGLNGQLGFKSASGGLRVRESRLSGFYVNTASGGCSIAGAFGPGEYDARTVSGRVELGVQPDFSGILTGRTVSGSFRCAVPYRDADHDWRDELEDDDEDDDMPEPAEDDEGEDRPRRGFVIDERGVSMPGIRIGDEGVTLPGIRIGHEGVELPGIRIGGRSREAERETRRALRDQKRAQRDQEREQRRRKRNRWEYLLGDPAIAATKATRLRVRTVSGSLSIHEGGLDNDMPDEMNAWTATKPANDQSVPPPRAGGWPDSELWPAASPTAPTPPTPPAPASPASTAIPPVPPAPPEAPVEQAGHVPSTARMEQPGARGPEQAPGVIHLPASPGDTPPAPPAATDEPPAATTTGADDTPVRTIEDARMEILQAVERKEITPDEALALLQQLDEEDQ